MFTAVHIIEKPRQTWIISLASLYFALTAYNVLERSYLLMDYETLMCNTFQLKAASYYTKTMVI